MRSARYVHPEFGYFCPTSSLYHELRVALFSALFGAIIGGGVIALSARLGRNTDTEMVPPPAAKAAPLPGAEDINRGGTNKTGASSVNVANAEASDADTARQACENDTWAYLDNKCSARKPRRAATDHPITARVPLGRSAMASDATSIPSAAAASASDGSKDSALLPVSEATPDSTRPAKSRPSAVAPKRPHKTARSQNRHRDDTWRDERADQRIGRGYASYEYRHSAFGRHDTYARERPDTGRGSWGWSW